MIINISNSIPEKIAPGAIRQETDSKAEGSSKLSMDESAVSPGDGLRGVLDEKDVSSSKAPDIVETLKRQLEELQKKLQEELRNLQKTQSGKQSEEAKAAAALAAQARIGALNASISTLTAALLNALISQGGSSSGSLVETTA
ncbi:hypothetical protein [Pseudomonas marginalis]|uniref:hypothetical protein n=1 Tax=Pseudomonas marginalis TaxID=298 RepID=UPI003B9E40F7